MQWVVAGLVCFGTGFLLSGCGTYKTIPTQVRNLPCEVKFKLSRGDTRQNVRSVLGKPLIDARSHGLEVYRQTGRDIDIDLPGVPIPMPSPGTKVIVIVLVAYDDQDLVKEIATEIWVPGRGQDYWITAGGYSFVNSGGYFLMVGHERSPDTLLAPPVSWEELEGMPTVKEECALVLLMGECPMEEVSLDKTPIIDLSPAGGYCCHDSARVRREHNYYGTFIRRNITPGSHRLNINQKTKHGNFETIFECAPGETIYAELEAHTTVDDLWYGVRLQGEITVNKSIPNNVVEMGELRSILWHRGAWYGQPIWHRGTWYGPPISSP